MEGKWDILPKVRHEANVKCADTFIDAIPLLLRVLEWGGRADTLLLYYMYVCPDLHIKGNFSSAKKCNFPVHISLYAMFLAPFSRGRTAGQKDSERCPLERHSSDRKERREIVFATPDSVVAGFPSRPENEQGRREREPNSEQWNAPAPATPRVNRPR